MVWLEKFQEYVTELRKSRPKLILCGDYNICHEPIDIHDPIRNATIFVLDIFITSNTLCLFISFYSF